MARAVKTAVLLMAAGGLLCAPAVGARERVSGEERLAKMLEGRVAGEPRSCIRTFPSVDLTVIDGTALVYESGSTLWVNRTEQPREIDVDDAVLSRRFSTRLCSTDVVTTFDPTVGFYTGNLFLSEFVPHRKAN